MIDQSGKFERPTASHDAQRERGVENVQDVITATQWVTLSFAKTKG